jgi:putative molybdopterin biosynthesis protein
MSETEKGTFDRKEAARLLGVSVVTVDRLLAQGHISHFRVGRRVLFTESHLNEYIEQNTRSAKRETRN